MLLPTFSETNLRLKMKTLKQLQTLLADFDLFLNPEPIPKI